MLDKIKIIKMNIRRKLRVLIYFAFLLCFILVSSFNRQKNELTKPLNDIKAFAHLGNYYSEKILGATALSKYRLSSDTND